MKAKNLCMYAGLCAGFATVAVAGGDKPTPQLLDSYVKVEPISIAKVIRENGKIVRTTDWIEYKGSSKRGPVDERVFDCFGDADSDGFMDDTGGCGQSSSRWFFGTAYCNGFATNDMFNVQANEAVGYGRADFGWYWTCAGFGTEQCQVAIFTQESDPRQCEGDSGDYSGWILNFGTLSCNINSYYYTNVDISSVGVWPAVTNGDGSYVMFFLTSSGSALATCAQPMLWGDGVNDGGAVANPRGEQDTQQLDDDNPLDGFHDVTSTTNECYTYNAGVCPDPLGAMLQFWGEPGGGDACDPADANNDGVVDTRDVLFFLNLWNQKDAASDCDNNGVIDTRDVLCFLNIWNGCN